MKLSVVIITLNEERNIGRCIQSVKNIADEILLVDSHSTDKTVAIAKEHGVKVILNGFQSYTQQRNFATEHAEYDWILMMDADEAVSDELEKSILSVKQNSTHNSYQFNRLNNYCGKWIRHGAWYPDRKIRLYNRNNGIWTGKYVHEYWKKNNEAESVGQLSGDLLHYSYYSIDEHIRQIQKFTELSAKAATEEGKTCSILKIWLGPKWYFIKNYFFRLGFLDGYYGYLVCKLTSYSQLIKYSKIRQYSKTRNINDKR